MRSVVFIAVSTYTKGFHMVPVLNALNVQCAVYGNHDFGNILYVAIVALYILQQCFLFCLFITCLNQRLCMSQFTVIMKVETVVVNVVVVDDCRFWY